MRDQNVSSYVMFIVETFKAIAQLNVLGDEDFTLPISYVDVEAQRKSKHSWTNISYIDLTVHIHFMHSGLASSIPVVTVTASLVSDNLSHWVRAEGTVEVVQPPHFTGPVPLPQKFTATVVDNRIVAKME